MIQVLLVFLAALLCAAAPADDMVPVPAGEFTMGRTKLTSDDKTKMRPQILLDDIPARKVFVSAFRLDRYEVTNRKYEQFVNSAKHKPPYHWIGGKVAQGSEDVAVYNISWDDAKAYCEWGGKRLPSEAEWERAARGGKELQDYPWGDKIDDKQARFNVESGVGPVGKYAPNDFGIFDMTGNVAEWTADWFAEDYYKKAESKDPHGPAAGTYKVIRGGAWSDSPKRVTVFFRNWVRPNQRTPNIGFRCAE